MPATHPAQPPAPAEELHPAQPPAPDDFTAEEHVAHHARGDEGAAAPGWPHRREEEDVGQRLEGLLICSEQVHVEHFHVLQVRHEGHVEAGAEEYELEYECQVKANGTLAR